MPLCQIFIVPLRAKDCKYENFRTAEHQTALQYRRQLRGIE